jgi:hypothetical protein
MMFFDYICLCTILFMVFPSIYHKYTCMSYCRKTMFVSFSQIGLIQDKIPLIACYKYAESIQIELYNRIANVNEAEEIIINISDWRKHTHIFLKGKSIINSSKTKRRTSSFIPKINAFICVTLTFVSLFWLEEIIKWQSSASSPRDQSKRNVRLYIENAMDAKY